MERNFRRRRPTLGVSLAAILLAVLLLVAAQPATAAPLTVGQVLGSIGNGKVKQFTQQGVLVDTLDTTTNSTFTAGGCFDGAGNFYVTLFNHPNGMSKFDSSGTLVTAAFGTGYNADPESCIVNAANQIYVGQADGFADVLKFDSSGALLDSFDVATENRGSDWIDLAADQCTLFYTSEGQLVLRYDVCADTQLANFATLPTSPCYALRIRPNGEVMVACTSQVHRLDATGTVIQSYTPPGASLLFALNLDPDGTSFWTGNLNSGEVFKIDITTGAVLEQWNSSPETALGGLAVVGEITVSRPTLDHFTCYSVGRSPAAGLHVRMHDQFGSQRRFVNRAQLLCPPVTKTREHEVTRPTNEQAHLKCYDVRRDEPFPTRRVRVVNQFSPAGQVLELAATALFCLPAVKDPQSGDPGPGELGLDHFKCYDTTGPAVRVRVGLEDQFQRTERPVGRPVLVCNPAGKLRLDNGEEIRPQNREAHLVCYSLGRTTALGRQVLTDDQFRAGQATTVQRLRLLCVPSTKERLRRGECAGGGADHCIDADGTTTPKEGIWDEQAGVFAADVSPGDALASFPGANPLNSGLLLFDQDASGSWTAPDDLVLEGNGFCGPSSVQDGEYDAGVDCVVLDLNGLGLVNLLPATVNLFQTTFDLLKYHDVNQNGSWDDSEDIVYSVDNVYN